MDVDWGRDSQIRERVGGFFHDDIILFRGLDRVQLRQITALMLEQTRRRLRAQDVALTLTDAAMDWLANQGYQPEFGARPLRRTIQREVDRKLSRMLLAGQINPGDAVTADVSGGTLDFRVEPGEAKADGGAAAAQPDTAAASSDESAPAR